MTATSSPPMVISRYDTADLTQADIDRVLTSRASAMLSFVDKLGYPRLLPCWFHWDGTAFYTTSDPTKFHVRCLVRNPRAAMCVEAIEGDLPAKPGGRRWHGQVKGFGDIELFHDPDERVGTLIRNRYLNSHNEPTTSLVESLTPADLTEPAAIQQNQRLVLRLAPQRLSAHGGGMHFVESPAS